MNLFKKTLVVLLVSAVTLTVGCGSKDNKESTTTNTQKTEYITELTKDNVEEVVIEYKEVLSYYNDLKNNLKTVSDVSKKPDMESDAVEAKDSIKNSVTLLKSTKMKYKPLVDAKAVLLNMYGVSTTLAESVVSEPSKYQSKLEEYDKYFKDFKKRMDEIRTEIEGIRGKTPTEDKTDENEKDKSKTDNKNSDQIDNNKDTDISDSNSNNSNKQKTKNDDNKNTGSSNTKNPNKSDDSSKNNNNNNSSNNNSDSEFVPKVSSLNNSIRNEIRNAGTSAGVNYKQSGGNASNINSVAAQMFNDLEGDNPIQGSQLSEARQIFINAFRQSYYGN